MTAPAASVCAFSATVKRPQLAAAAVGTTTVAGSALKSYKA